jgi:translation initiation factor 2 subunit 3
METQPIMNIGMLGHVSDGKTTITKQITGTLTQKHSSEKQQNLTIRLGYANAKICKCNSCTVPTCYFSIQSELIEYTCPKCLSDATLMNHISFVDCPGHNMLLATMLNGTSVMDYTLTIESAVNTHIPAPQTLEHIDCIKNLNIKNIGIVLNKVDLISKEKTEEICEDLSNFIKQNNINSPIIPLSATHNINIDILCMILAHLPKPNRNMDRLKMPIIRSFNINKPGTQIEDLVGGVVGGSIISGSIKKEQQIFLVPGLITDTYYKPISCIVNSINSDKTCLDQAFSGGLIGVQLDIDPGLSCDDKLVGNVVVDKISGIVTNEFNLKINKPYDNLWKNKSFTFNINSTNIDGKIKKISEDTIKVILESYQYIEHQDVITISVNTGGSSIHLLDYCKFDINCDHNILNLYENN